MIRCRERQSKAQAFAKHTFFYLLCVFENQNGYEYKNKTLDVQTKEIKVQSSISVLRVLLLVERQAQGNTEETAEAISFFKMFETCLRIYELIIDSL